MPTGVNEGTGNIKRRLCSAAAKKANGCAYSLVKRNIAAAPDTENTVVRYGNSRTYSAVTERLKDKLKPLGIKDLGILANYGGYGVFRIHNVNSNLYSVVEFYGFCI